LPKKERLMRASREKKSTITRALGQGGKEFKRGGGLFPSPEERKGRPGALISVGERHSAISTRGRKEKKRALTAELR